MATFMAGTLWGLSIKSNESILSSIITFSLVFLLSLFISFSADSYGFLLHSCDFPVCCFFGGIDTLGRPVQNGAKKMDLTNVGCNRKFIYRIISYFRYITGKDDRKIAVRN